MRQILLLIVGFLFFSSFGTLRSENIMFNYLGVSDGISQNSVTALAQDSIGRIWIGTRDGLNLYDGVRIKNFRQSRGGSNSLLGHFVNDIKIDGNDLWVVTKSGISQMDIRNFNFTLFPKEGVITTIQYKGKRLVGTKYGLLMLDLTDKTFLNSEILPDNTMSVSHLNVDRSGTLWVSTNKGLYAHFADNVTLKILDENTTVSFVDSLKQTWVGTTDKGIFVLDAKRNVIRHFVHDKSANSIVSNVIRDIKEDVDGNIWVGTFKGLSIINRQNYAIKNHNSDDKRAKSLSQNSIYTILRDRQDGMWLGTFFGGISYYNQDLYKQYDVVKEGDYGTSCGVIGEIIEDDKSNLWIATEGGGLNYFNREENKFVHYQHTEGQSGLSQDIIRSLYLKDKNTLYIGTHLGGLNVLDIKSGQVEVFMHNPENANSIPSNIVRDIIPYNGILLLATGNGVAKFNPTTNTFSRFLGEAKTQPVSGLVNCLLEDSFGTLWIGTEDYGLYAFNRQSGKLKRYTTSSTNLNSIGDNNISCIFEDHLFRLWIGTMGGGLNRFVRDKGYFEVYDMDVHDFPSNFILGIKESNFGNLWVSTSKGLSLFDVDRGKVYNYYQKNGLPIDELNQGALCLTNDGELFVGGIHGLISFDEKMVLHQKQRHNITFGSLIVNNKEVSPMDDTEILENSLAYTDNIKLKPNHNVFTISYSACNYVKTNKNTYRYKLENFDKDWVEAEDQTSVTYTNLNPGTYKLIVQGLSGVEGDVIGEKILTIEILPPIYNTWYAYVLYVIIAILGLGWMERMYRNRIDLENRIKAEQREKEQINLLNQSKLEFFTNISHEFRTPLTLIEGTLESILENPKTIKENQDKITSTHKNVVRLNNLVTELLDFRKLELGYSILKVQEVDFEVFLGEIHNSFVDYARHHAIEFVYINQATVKLWLDKCQIEKVFYNLLSNAFKFVDDVQGTVSVVVSESSTYVDVLIKDNGIGITKEKITSIFDPYYQIDNVEINPKRKGTGIGLALCKNIITAHHGEILITSDEYETVFTIRLLKGKAHYQQSDFCSEQITSGNGALTIFEGDKDEFTNAEEVPQEVEDYSLSILIVEDNPQVRILLKSIFKDYYKIYEAVDGEDGVQKAVAKQPDLIISDVMMPKLSGIQLCTMLKRNIQTSHIPVLLLSANATEEFKIEGLEIGADDYITKPFSNKLLRIKVKNLINNRLLLQQKFKNNPTIQVTEITSNTIDQQFLKQARDVVERNIDKTEFVSADFAHEMGIGRSKLFDKVKGLTGLTPNDFILSIRLTRAAEMLLNDSENLNISEISYAVGFSTASYFSKCFKQHYGVTPTQYAIHKTKKE